MLEEKSRVESWFRNQMCLLLIDDISVREGIDDDGFRFFSEMLCTESLIVYITRHQKLLGCNAKPILFEPRVLATAGCSPLAHAEGPDEDEIDLNYIGTGRRLRRMCLASPGVGQ